MQRPQSTSFGAKAETFLDEFYKSVNAVSPQQKQTVLQFKMGRNYNFYPIGGDLNDEMRLACLEYEYLVLVGILETPLA